VAFRLVTFGVSFVENGLPAGGAWTVLLGGIPTNSTASTIALSEPNGSYAYSVTGPVGYPAQPSSGTVSVAGSPVSLPIRFTRSIYNVTFTEIGLPAGGTWWINLTAGGGSPASNGTSLVLPEVNGTYRYTAVSADPRFAAGSGSVTVSGGPVNLTVTFATVRFTITVLELGLPAGTNWSVTLEGVTRSTAGSSVNFTETNGTYAYNVTGPAGYSALPRSGQIGVAGGPAEVAVVFTRPLAPPGPLGFLEPTGTAALYLLAGVLGAVALTLLVVFGARRRRGSS
jgi:hypothetical protein